MVNTYTPLDLTTPTGKYVITGVDFKGRRFTPKHTNNLAYAMGHNIAKGNLWEILANGHRRKIHTWS